MQNIVDKNDCAKLLWILRKERAMRDNVRSILSQLIVGRQETINHIMTCLKEDSSQLIEVVGQVGTGKSYLFKALSKTLTNLNINHTRYIPRLFNFNQLREIVKLVSTITDEEYDQVIRLNFGNSNNNKYDFFFALTETLNYRKLFKPTILVIDNCDLLDSYSIDFIQYLVQYAADHKIHIVTFNTTELFPFSIREHLELLSAQEIQTTLYELYDRKDIDYAIEADVLKNITGGNVYILENILSEMMEDSNRSNRFDLQAYIQKKYDIETIYWQKIEKLSKDHLSTMISIYLLDRHATREDLKFLTEIENRKLGIILDFLIDEGYIAQKDDNNYYLRKSLVFQKYFNELPADTQEHFIHKTIAYTQIDKHDKFRSFRFSMQIKQYDAIIAREICEYLELIKDYESLQEVYKFCLDNSTTVEDQVSFLFKIGVINTKCKHWEVAADYFRQALRYANTQTIQIEEIVFLLAETLYSMNSSTFALEVIKTYSPEKFDTYWQCRLRILKSEILMELEDFHEAHKSVDEAFQLAVQIEDKTKRYNLQAESKKTKGKIYYFSNQWDKAELAFKEAETFFLTTNNIGGLAAIYNNIGVLKMFQGEWDKTEKLYLDSLNLEKKRYNLEGIAICYNNLGGLADDQGDYKKSLYYFHEALKIQKLLSERYNITNCYNNIGVTYMDNNEYEKAAEAFKQSLQTAINFGLYRNIIASLNNLGALYFKSGDWTKAIEYYERAIEKSKENGFMEGLLRSYNNLGELYENRGEYNLAYDLYFKGHEILPQITDEFLKAELFGNLGSVLTHLHKFSEAYGYLVESYDFFRTLNAKDKIVEGCQKQAFYFIQTRNYESADYYLNLALKTAKEINNQFMIGKTYYYRALLERKDLGKAIVLFEDAIRIFIETKNNFDLAVANFEYASALNEKGDWDKALEILMDNTRLIKDFGAIKLLEQNDNLISKLNREHVAELKESKVQETLLNKFSEITTTLNAVTDFDLLLDTALQSLCEFSEADGAILSLYNMRNLPDSWEYKLFQHFSTDDKDYDMMMDLTLRTFNERKNLSFKQPPFAPKYNDIITFNLSIRNNNQGVILLFSRHGAHYFSEKMVNLLSALCNQIIVIIENIRHSNLAKSHAVLREELETSNVFTNIVGKSEKMISIFELIDKIKDAPTTVLVEGPSGTGKELIARAIHYNSNRRNKKFVAQYCGALPETLLESELFGHVKGSFTGATYDKKGLFEIADGGTFFLDEIADISLSTQAKLLRFLQEGEIKRVGSTKTETVDVRVICATNVSLQERVKQGEFRLDLYYRLNVIRIDVPSLKERRSDIPLLAIHFLDKYNKKIMKRVSGITDETMKYLCKCDWPGNIRQLENEIERAVTLTDNDTFIKPTDLSEEVFRYSEHTETLNMLSGKMSLKDAVEDLERQMISKCLEDCGWNQTQASKELGLSRQGLIKKMKRYQLEK